MKKRLIFLLFAAVAIVCSAIGVTDNLNKRVGQSKNNKITLSINNTPEWAPRLVNSDKSEFLSLGSGKAVLPQKEPMKMPMRLSPSGSMIQGLRTVSNDPTFSSKGWYELSTDGTETELWTSEELVETIGFVKDNVLYGFFSIELWGSIFVNWDMYDLSTGKLISNGELDSSNYSNMVLSVVYDEYLDVAYAYTYNADKSGALLQKFDLETKTFTIINDDADLVDNRMIAWAYNPKDNQIYGIDTKGFYCKMNKKTGEFTQVGDTRIFPSTYSQSMVYSPLDHAFIWAAILPDQTSCLYSVDPTTGVATLLHQFEYVNQYTILATPDKICADNAPGLVEFNSLTFEKAELNGVGEVTLPSVNYIGEPIQEDVYVKVLVDGVSNQRNLSGKPGESITFNLTLTEGQHLVSVIPYFKDGFNDIEGHPVKKEVYVGYDTPQAPKNVVLTKSFLDWDPVPAVGINGGYVDKSEVYYNVYINGVKQNDTPVFDTQMNIVIEDAPLAYYQAEVEAVAHGKVSEKGASEEMLIGHAFTIPFEMIPTEADCKLFTFIDNGYGYWRYDETESGLAHLTHKDYDADDWVFLPLIKLDETESLYEISFDARARLSSNPETFEIAISSTTNPSDAKIVYSETINNNEYATKRVVFSVDKPGEYYVAFRCVSPADSFFLYIKNIKIDLTEKVPDCPTKCDYLTAQAAPYGELKAKVSFKMPTKTISGKSLYTMSPELTAVITSTEETITVTGKPGSLQNVELQTAQGRNEITVAVSNSYGEGEVASTQVYTGEDAPIISDVTSTISEDNLTVTLHWVPSSTGVNGGYVNTETLKYNVYRVNSKEQWEQIDEVENTTSYSYSVAEGSELSYERIGITMSNEYGATEEIAYTSCVIGTPYTLPMVENFPGELTYDILLEQPLDESYTGGWQFADPAQLDPSAIADYSVALIGYPQTYGDTYGRIALPKFSTEGATNVEFKVNCYFGEYTPPTDFFVCGNSDEEAYIGSIDASTGSGWQTVSFDLPKQFLDRQWSYVAVRSKYNGTQQFIIIGGYTIKNVFAQDLAVSAIEGPSSMLVGDNETIRVKVENVGFETIDIPATIYCDVVNDKEEVVGSLDASAEPDMASLQPGEYCYYEYELKAEVNYLGEVKVKAYFENSDMDLTNNVAFHNLKVNKSTEPIVTDLSAKVADDKTSVELSWSEPVLSLDFDDFEGLESFSYEEELGQWKNVDNDYKVTWIVSGWDYPDMGTPKAFQVFNYKEISNGGSAFAPFSGDQYLMAICPEDASAADDWLISPEIKGGSGISFYWNIINEKYSPEKVEIMYSTTTQNIEAFKWLKTVSKKRLGWEMEIVSLPEDAKYFALHYISADKFGIMIDDISFASAESTAEIVGYNIYRNGIKIAEKVDATTYVDTTIEAEADYYYNVTVVVSDQGVETEYAKSNTANADTSGIFDIFSNKAIYALNGAIAINGFAGEVAVISTIDGKVVATPFVDEDEFVVSVEEGIYIVKVGKTICKIIIR